MLNDYPVSITISQFQVDTSILTPQKPNLFLHHGYNGEVIPPNAIFGRSMIYLWEIYLWETRIMSIHGLLMRLFPAFCGGKDIKWKCQTFCV